MGEAVHGSIDVTRTSSTATYNAGTSVTVYFAPDSGYILSSDNITITDATGEPVARSSFTKLGEVQYAVSFTMPSSNVTVSAVLPSRQLLPGNILSLPIMMRLWVPLRYRALYQEAGMLPLP